MSLHKAIEYGKEKRKPYRDGKAVSSHCRNNNACIWCRDNRLHSNKKRKMRWEVEKEDICSK